ncbi:hypothetical protein HK100_009546, partial [Physocladia obscura]
GGKMGTAKHDSAFGKNNQQIPRSQSPIKKQDVLIDFFASTDQSVADSYSFNMPTINTWAPSGLGLALSGSSSGAVQNQSFVGLPGGAVSNPFGYSSFSSGQSGYSSTATSPGHNPFAVSAGFSTNSTAASTQLGQQGPPVDPSFTIDNVFGSGAGNTSAANPFGNQSQGFGSQGQGFGGQPQGFGSIQQPSGFGSAKNSSKSTSNNPFGGTTFVVNEKNNPFAGSAAQPPMPQSSFGASGNNGRAAGFNQSLQPTAVSNPFPSSSQSNAFPSSSQSNPFPSNTTQPSLFPSSTQSSPFPSTAQQNSFTPLSSAQPNPFPPSANRTLSQPFSSNAFAPQQLQQNGFGGQIQQTSNQILSQGGFGQQQQQGSFDQNQLGGFTQQQQPSLQMGIFGSNSGQVGGQQMGSFTSNPGNLPQVVDHFGQVNPFAKPTVPLSAIQESNNSNSVVPPISLTPLYNGNSGYPYNLMTSNTGAANSSPAVQKSKSNNPFF